MTGARDQILETGPDGERRWNVTWVVPAGSTRGAELRRGTEFTIDDGLRFVFDYATEEGRRLVLWAVAATGSDGTRVQIDPTAVTKIHRRKKAEREATG